MYTMYIYASNDTPFHTHVSLYVVWYVHLSECNIP